MAVTIASVGDALLEDILVHPGADDLRLIYADWLEDNDQPERAEFIRVQMAMHRLLCNSPPRINEVERTPYSMYCQSTRCKHCELDRRAGTLCTDATWLPAAAFVNDHGRKEMFWRRGFLYKIEAPLTFLLEHLPRIVREQPVELADPIDRFPDRNPGSHTNDSWMWSRGVSPQSSLGQAWEYLPGSSEVSHLGSKQTARIHAGFATEAEAREGACMALVAWAKSIKCLECNDTGAILKRLAPDTDIGALTTYCPVCTLKPSLPQHSALLTPTPGFFIEGTS